MTGLHAALAELAAEWADRTPRSDAPRDRRECAAVLHALLASHVPSGQVDHEQAYRDLRAGVEALVLAAWDDGNATGLDGWIGPERGEEPDPEGIRARERFADHAAALLTSSVPATASEGATEHRLVGEIGRQACTCGWEPALGTSVWREFDKHLLATGVTSSWDHLTGPEQQAVRSLAEDCSKPGSSLENAGSTDGDREGLSDERRELLLTLALADGQGWRGWVNTSEHTAEMMYGRQADAVERILAARLAEVTAERDEAKAERDEARAVRAWVGERGDDHLDRVLRKTTHCDCGGWDQVFELQTESPRPLFGGIRPWKYAGITLKGQSSHARACPKSWRNSPDEKLAHTEARADALAEQVAAIQALHRPDGGIDGPGAMCVSCTADFGTPAEDPTPWPCPTAVVLADPGSALAARDTKVAAQARAELLAKVQDVYDLQCPVRPSEDYTHPAARVAHKWWQTVLGGLLDRERAAGGEVEQP